MRLPSPDHCSSADFRKALGYFDFQCQPVFCPVCCGELRKGRTAPFATVWGWCHLWKIIHLQCVLWHHTWRRKGAGTEWFSFLVKIQREGRFPQNYQGLENWGFGQTVSWDRVERPGALQGQSCLLSTLTITPLCQWHSLTIECVHKYPPVKACKYHHYLKLVQNLPHTAEQSTGDFFFRRKKWVYFSPWN